MFSYCVEWNLFLKTFSSHCSPYGVHTTLLPKRPNQASGAINQSRGRIFPPITGLVILATQNRRASPAEVGDPPAAGVEERPVE
jgi:hypothetical protein